jgi:hypothetical protein
MSGRVEVIEDEVTPNTYGADPEKTPPHATNEEIRGQISHEMLEELAPNGEGEYILEKICSMSEEEGLAIIDESIKFHADDWNFPAQMRERMKRLLDGPKLYGDFWDRDLRIDAAIMRYSSPYPGVRAVAEPLDDASIPVETIRAYFLGIGWAIIGTFMSTFFNSRFPSIGESTRETFTCPFSRSNCIKRSKRLSDSNSIVSMR